MKIRHTLAVAGIATLLSVPFAINAWAATATPISSVKNLSNGEDVTVTGTVQDFDERHPFTLQDSSGNIQIDLSSAKPIVLKNGQKVTITGTIDKGLLTTDIMATDVNIDTSVGEKIGNAIDSITGQSTSTDAQVVRVQSLPDTGLVKIKGVVDSVDGSKKFTLRDSTGQVDVNLKQDQTLRRGSEVTVVGYVDKSLIGKGINATEVDVNSSNP